MNALDYLCNHKLDVCILLWIFYALFEAIVDKVRK